MVPGTPVPAVGVPETVSAGQVVAQFPVQALVPEPTVSLSNLYTVRPEASTTTEPRDVVPTPTVAAAAALAVVAVELVVVELLPHAASSNPTMRVPAAAVQLRIENMASSRDLWCH
jgi:hypothetical protein